MSYTRAIVARSRGQGYIFDGSSGGGDSDVGDSFGSGGFYRSQLCVTLVTPTDADR